MSDTALHSRPESGTVSSRDATDISAKLSKLFHPSLHLAIDDAGLEDDLAVGRASVTTGGIPSENR